MKQLYLKIIWAYAIILIVLAYMFGLSIDLTGDSGLYAAISRQMVESGDWFNLKINGESYDQKPHLIFWLAGMGIKLFGNTNFAFKILPFLFGILGLYFTYRLGNDLFSAKVGKSAILICASSQIFLLYFLDIHTDTILQTGVTLALWKILTYFRNRKILNLILGFTGIGLAMLTKGPVGAVLPFSALLIYLIAEKDFVELLHPKWILGIVIILVVISPTLIHLFKSFGLEGIKFYFITNNFGRITGEYAGSSNDPFFYLYNILWAFIPWTIIVISSVFFEIKSWYKKKIDSRKAALTGSVLILLVILSIAKGKAPNYILMAIAPLSVIAAVWIVDFQDFAERTKKNLVLSQDIFSLILAVFFAVLVITFWYKVIIIQISVFLVSGIVLFNLFRKKADIKRILLFLLVINGNINVLLNTTLIPDLFKYQGARQALAIYESERSEDDILINLHVEEYELFYYAESPVIQFSTWEDFYDLFDRGGTWIYTTREGYQGILEYNDNLDSVYVIKHRGMNNISFSFVNPKTREDNLYENYLIKVH